MANKAIRSMANKPRKRRTGDSSVTRARNETSLVEALVKALSGKTLSVDEATKAVLAAGYRSASPAFRRIVNITLSRNSRFERVARGRYTVK